MFEIRCILHSIPLEESGYLNIDLSDHPGGMASALKGKFICFRHCNATSLRTCSYDNTPDDEEEVERLQPTSIHEARRFLQEWQTVMQVLMNHHQFRNK